VSLLFVGVYEIRCVLLPSRLVRIVECSVLAVITDETRHSRKKRSSSRMEAGLKPWLLNFYGGPPEYLPEIQEDFVPGVEVVRVFDGPRNQMSLKTTYDKEDDCHIHPHECGCDDDKASYDTYNHYLKAFFIHSSSKSLQANHFRFKAIDAYRANESRNLHREACHEVEMTSATGNTWTYGRQAYSACMFGDILFDEMEGCLCDDPACEEGFGVSVEIVLALVKSLIDSSCLCPYSLTVLSFLAPRE
jgi:hypothetical protein